MSQGMRRDAFGDTEVRRFLTQLLNRGRPKMGAPLLAGKQKVGWAFAPPVLAEKIEDQLAKDRVAVLAAFAVADADEHAR